MRITLGQIVIAVGILAPACVGQGLFDQLNYRNVENAGFKVYGLSLFSGYTTYGSPQSGQPPANINYGASFSAGWTHHREKTNFSVMYFGTYGGVVEYPEFNGYNQGLSFSGSRQISRKWTGSITGSAQDVSLSQALFQPSSISVTSQILTSFNDFAASYGVGQFSANQVQSLFNNLYLESAIRSGLLGGRTLAYGGQALLNYGYSPNLQFHFSGSEGGGENLSSPGDTTAPPNYAMPQSLGADAGVSYSHGFSPRTQVGLNLDENYMHNFYQNAYLSTATASFGRKMGSRWFLRMYGGGSYTRLLEKSVGVGNTLQAVGGGSIGFHLLTQTLAATYDRTAINGYNFATGTTTTMMASWNWHRPAGKLGLSSSFGEEEQRNTGYVSISGWQGSAGVSERLGTQVAASLDYIYLDTTERFSGSMYRIKTSGVRATVSWSPRPVLR